MRLFWDILKEKYEHYSFINKNIAGIKVNVKVYYAFWISSITAEILVFQIVQMGARRGKRRDVRTIARLTMSSIGFLEGGELRGETIEI